MHLADGARIEHRRFCTAENAEVPYAEVVKGFEVTGRAAAGRCVFHNREHLAIIRSLDGVLALHTMRYADEVVSGSDVDIPTSRAGPRSARSTWPHSSSKGYTRTSTPSSTPTSTARRSSA